MPPRLRSTRGASGEAKSSTSAIGTSGAPCPPAARSRARKLLTTRTPNRSARTAGSPSCQVTVGGSCQIVWPWNAMSASSDAGTRACTRTVSTASAAHSPRRTWSRASDGASPPASARRSSARSSSV